MFGHSNTHRIQDVLKIFIQSNQHVRAIGFVVPVTSAPPRLSKMEGRFLECDC